MAVPATTDEFLALVRRSGVVEPDLLDPFTRRVFSDATPFRDPQRLATVMVREGLLSPLQAGYLLRGKWRNWILCGKYKILEYLGAGGMGHVFLCEHIRMRRLVAVKVMPTEKSDDSVLLQRLVREARAAAALNHPNIVRAYDLDCDGHLHFIVMDYVDGISLHDVVAKSGPLPVARACEYIRQAALGLQHAHENGLVHRDIKPANLLLERSGVVKVHDLGLVLCFHDSESITQRISGRPLIGTADYLAPEQALNSHTVDTRADIYSLGATLYFLLTGRSPFPDGTVAQKLMDHQVRAPDPVRKLRSDVPPELDAAIQRMLAKEPKDRFQQPIDVVAALEPWTNRPIPPPAENEMPRVSRAVRRFESPATPLPTGLRIPRSPSAESASRTSRHSVKVAWLTKKSWAALAAVIVGVGGAGGLYALLHWLVTSRANAP